MFQNLIALASRDFPISETDIELCKTFFTPLEVGKDEVLVEAGVVASHLYFINSGYIRVYHDSRGLEATSQLASSGDFVTAFDSFISLRAAQENVHCVTDCQLLQINKNDLDQLYAKSKNCAMFIRLVYNKSIALNEQRANDILLSKPETRYAKLIANYPGISGNVPLQYIASYLGVQNEILIELEKSRIKNTD